VFRLGILDPEGLVEWAFERGAFNGE